jgi:hypothetical protein
VGDLGRWACRGDLLGDVIGCKCCGSPTASDNSGLGSRVWPGEPGTSSSSDPGTKEDTLGDGSERSPSSASSLSGDLVSPPSSPSLLLGTLLYPPSSLGGAWLALTSCSDDSLSESLLDCSSLAIIDWVSPPSLSG